MNSLLRPRYSEGTFTCTVALFSAMRDGPLPATGGLLINLLGDALSGGEVGVMQHPAHGFDRHHRRRRALDDGTFWNAPRGWMIHHFRISRSTCGESSSNNRALRGRVNLSVEAAQRTDDQRASLQCAGIAHGGNQHVHLHAWARKRGQQRGNHHGRRVPYLNGGGRNGDAHALQQVRQALRRKNSLLAVALSGQTNHQPIANQMIIADALDTGEIFQARGADRCGIRAQ